VVLEGGEVRHERQAVPAGHVFVDGLEVAGSVQGVIRDRRHLAEDGVVVVTLAVDMRTGEIVQGPDLDSHGFMDDPSAVFAKAVSAIREEIEGIDRPFEVERVRRHVRSAVNRVTRLETGRKAVVIVVVLEV
jgi:ribonuclease J